MVAADLLPPQVLVSYEVPGWTARSVPLIYRWLDSAGEALLFVASVIVPFAGIPDRNVMINHRSKSVVSIRIVAIVPFSLDSRLFRP